MTVLASCGVAFLLVTYCESRLACDRLIPAFDAWSPCGYAAGTKKQLAQRKKVMAAVTTRRRFAGHPSLVSRCCSIYRSIILYYILLCAETSASVARVQKAAGKRRDKRCSTCKQVKPIEEFSVKWAKGRDRIRGSCRACTVKATAKARAAAEKGRINLLRDSFVYLLTSMPGC